MHDPINIQISTDNKLVDFGSYIFLKKTDRDLWVPELNNKKYSVIDKLKFKGCDVSNHLIQKNSVHFLQDTAFADSSSDHLYELCLEISNLALNKNIETIDMITKIQPYLDYVF